jgi:hypothetical protein
VILRAEVIERGLPRQRLDPAHTGRGRAVAKRHEDADIAGLAHMGAAAKLQRIGLPVAALARPVQRAHRHDPHLVAVFLAEKRLRPDAARVVRRHDPGFHGRVLADEIVHLPLDLRNLLQAQRLAMAEVEAQPVGRIERAALRHVIAKRAAQRLVQQVRGRMVGADRAAAGVIDLQHGGLAGAISPSVTSARCRNTPATFLVSVTRRAVSVFSVPVSPTWPPASA